MKIERKDVKKIRVQHNKKLFWLIIVLMAILICLAIYIGSEKQKAGKECSKDEDCVPATCCHPQSCTTKEKAPKCEKMICSMECSGPLDCSAGSCGCVEGKCEITPNK